MTCSTESVSSVAAEAPAIVEDTVTSPVRDLQKKTDLFQLQKVVTKTGFYEIYILTDVLE